MSASIKAWGDYSQAVEHTPPELKALVKETTGQAVRRVGRFIQLALIGAGRCVAGSALPADTAVYLASGRGDMEITVEVMEQLFRDGQPPKPLSFINTVSNAACFYIAQQFALEGRSSFVCNRYFAFESALQLALLDLELGAVESALVGVVDVVVPPLQNHRERLELAEDQPIAEGSHWLLLDKNSTTSAGDVIAAEHFCERAALIDWISAQSLPKQRCHISAGQFLTQSELAAIQRECGIEQRFDYRNQLAYYDSQSGAAIGKFLSAAGGEKNYLLHINADPDGRYNAMLVCS